MIPFRHQWEIENVRKLFEQNITGYPSIYSSIFTAADNYYYKFQLVLCPWENDETNKDYMSLQMMLVRSTDQGKVTVQFKFSIVDCHGKICNVKGGSKTFDKNSEDTRWEDGQYILRKLLLNWGSGLLKNGQFTVLCEGEIIEDGDRLSQTDLENHYNVFKDKQFIHVSTMKSYFNAHIRTIPFVHQWSIDNISNLFNDQLTIESPIFYPSNNKKYEFKIKMFSNRFKEEYKDNIVLLLESASIFNGIMQIKVSIIDQNGVKLYINGNSNIFENYKTLINIGKECYITKQALMNSDNGFLKNDKLTLLCEGEIILGYNDFSETDKTNHFEIFNFKNFNDIPKFISNARLQTVPFIYQWTIDKFINLITNPLTEHPSIDSPIFSPLNNPQYQFKLRMYPKGEDKESKHYVSLFLVLLPNLQDKVAVQHKFSIIDCDGDECYTNGRKIFETYFCNIYVKNCLKSWGLNKYIRHEELLNPTNKLLKNDKLTILSEGEVIVDGDKLYETDLYNLWEIFRSKQKNSVTNVENNTFEKSDIKQIQQNIENDKHHKDCEKFDLIQLNIESLQTENDKLQQDKENLDSNQQMIESPQTENDKYKPNDQKLDPIQLNIESQQTENDKLQQDKENLDSNQQMIESPQTENDKIIFDSEKLSKIKKILSILIENNLFQIKLNNSDDQNYDFRNAPLENFHFSCNSEFEFARIINSENQLKISQSDRKKYFENLDHLIKSNFEHFISVLQKCFQLRHIIRNNNYKLTKSNSVTFENSEKTNKNDDVKSKEEIENETEKYGEDNENFDQIQQTVKIIEKLEKIETTITEQKVTIDQTIFTVNNIYHEHYLENANFKDSLVNTKSQSNFGDINIKTELSDCTELIEKLQTIMNNEIKPVLDQNEQMVTEIKSSQSNDAMLIDLVLKNQKLILENREEMKTIQKDLYEMKQTKNVTQPEMKQTVDKVLLFLNRIKFEMNKVVVNISSQIRQSIATQQKLTGTTSGKLNSFSDHILLHSDPLIKYLQSVPASVLIDNQTKESHIQNVENAKNFLITYLSTEIAANPNSNLMLDPLTLEKAEQKLSDIIGDQTSDSNMNDQQKLVRLCGLMVEFKPEFNGDLPDKEKNSKY